MALNLTDLTNAIQADFDQQVAWTQAREADARAKQAGELKDFWLAEFVKVAMPFLKPTGTTEILFRLNNEPWLVKIDKGPSGRDTPRVYYHKILDAEALNVESN